LFVCSKVLGGGYKVTCETDATCNLYVVLVLYKVRVAASAGGGGGAGDDEWETKCDYLRFWSTAGTSAAFHHHAMHIAKRHVVTKVPGLQLLRAATDGHKSTYKGSPNFGRMSYWPLEMPSAPVPGFVLALTLHQSPSAPRDFECNDQLMVSALSGKAAAEEAVILAVAAASAARASAAGKMLVPALRTALAAAGLSDAGLRADLLARFLASSLVPTPPAVGTPPVPLAAAPPAVPPAAAALTKQWRVHAVDGAVVRTAQELEDALAAAEVAERNAVVELLEVHTYPSPLGPLAVPHAIELSPWAGASGLRGR
jgi:hypothetical protein